jgi:hypothetical protein
MAQLARASENLIRELDIEQYRSIWIREEVED